MKLFMKLNRQQVAGLRAGASLGFGVSALAVLVLASEALAQPEQWLQYHASREGRAYRWLEATTNAPAGVALPKLNAKPFFVHWNTPLDPKGRWLCFDRSRRSGSYDRLYADTTGDGRLDNKAAVTTSALDQINSMFSPVRMVFKGEDGPITYHLLLRVLKYGDNDVRVLAQSGGYYAGTVNFGGKKHRVELIDANVNGAFDDLASDPDSCDEIQVSDDKETEQRCLGRLLEVDGQLFRVEVARDGAFIKVQKAENVALGKVRVPEKISALTAVGENGQFTRKPDKGELSLPAGSYRIHQWLVERKDQRGALWHMTADRFDAASNFKASPDSPVSLDIGEPVRMVLEPFESRGEVSFRLQFAGRRGEMIDIMRGSERPRPPMLTLTSLDGSYRYTNSFEFG